VPLGTALSKFYGLIASCTIYAGVFDELDAVRLFNAGPFMTNRFIYISETVFVGNSSSVSTEFTQTFANSSVMEHSLNRPFLAQQNHLRLFALLRSFQEIALQAWVVNL
jgi:hypothetical protein